MPINIDTREKQNMTKQEKQQLKRKLQAQNGVTCAKTHDTKLRLTS